MVRVATLLLLAFAPVFAKSWTGLLVDSNCFASEERNVNKNTSDVEHDVGMEVRLCSPKPETKAFAIVLPDSEVLKLDSAGNAKAAEIARSAGKRSMLHVTVSGAVDKTTIQTSSMSVDK
jgi:hypothetical protein